MLPAKGFGKALHILASLSSALVPGQNQIKANYQSLFLHNKLHWNVKLAVIITKNFWSIFRYICVWRADISLKQSLTRPSSTQKAHCPKNRIQCKQRFTSNIYFDLFFNHPVSINACYCQLLLYDWKQCPSSVHYLSIQLKEKELDKQTYTIQQIT